MIFNALDQIWCYSVVHTTKISPSGLIKICAVCSDLFFRQRIEYGNYMQCS